MSESSSTDRDEPLRKMLWAYEGERNKKKTVRKEGSFGCVEVCRLLMIPGWFTSCMLNTCYLRRKAMECQKNNYLFIIFKNTNQCIGWIFILFLYVCEDLDEITGIRDIFPVMQLLILMQVGFVRILIEK